MTPKQIANFYDLLKGYGVAQVEQMLKRGEFSGKKRDLVLLWLGRPEIPHNMSPDLFEGWAKPIVITTVGGVAAGLVLLFLAGALQ